MTTCLLPGCGAPTPENGDGRPRDFCSNAHRQAMHRLVSRLVRLILLDLAAHPIVGSRATTSRPADPFPLAALPGAAPATTPGRDGEEY